MSRHSEKYIFVLFFCLLGVNTTFLAMEEIDIPKKKEISFSASLGGDIDFYEGRIFGAPYYMNISVTHKKAFCMVGVPFPYPFPSIHHNDEDNNLGTEKDFENIYRFLVNKIRFNNRNKKLVFEEWAPGFFNSELKSFFCHLNSGDKKKKGK